jgi:SPASM domain peptide maturase of grasp-with-spasm system
MIDTSQYFKLYACCMPVKGAAQSIICDTQRGEYRIIPNDLCDILLQKDGTRIDDLIAQYGEDNREILVEYFETLYAHEFIFLCPSEAVTKLFPPIELRWDYPALITNALIDVDENSNHDFGAIFKQLENLGCSNIEIRLFVTKEVAYLNSIFNAMEGSIIEHVSIVTPAIPGFSIPDYNLYFATHQRLVSMIIHSCTDDTLLKGEQSKMFSLTFIPQTVNNADCCGFIHPQSFNSTLDFFAESQQFNSCLNRKISIDAAGNIKNCPAMKQSMGHISHTSLASVIGQDEFTKYWHINKDQVNICKDCEFRYICHDCRTFIENPQDLFSKPLKCSYNPYEARWEDEVIAADMAAEHAEK